MSDKSLRRKVLGDSDKELVMALVESHRIEIGIPTMDGIEDRKRYRKAIEHSKLDLQHSIELLEEVSQNINCNADERDYILTTLSSLYNQLEHLNSI